MLNPRATRRNVNKLADGLVASYCKGCGLLIAASPMRKTLDVMENIHECPVYFHYQLTPEPEVGVAWPVSIGRAARLLVYLR
jgi:hypothetical protein